MQNPDSVFNDKVFSSLMLMFLAYGQYNMIKV